MTAPDPIFYSPWSVQHHEHPPLCAAPPQFSSEARPVGCDLSLAARETEESAAPHSATPPPPGGTDKAGEVVLPSASPAAQSQKVQQS